MVDIPVRVLAYTLGPTLVGLVVAAGLTGWFHRAAQCGTDLRHRARTLAPFALLLGLVLLFNAYVRPRFDDISLAFGINLTDHLYVFEGGFVPWLQGVTPEPLVFYFSAVYVVGYGVLLMYPPVAYAVLDDLEHAARLFTAYALNYFVGALLYIAVVAFGPRNYFLPTEVQQPLYTHFPDVMYLTSAVNTNSNVFPSLHASMAVTVLMLAYYTRSEYPRWFAITLVLSPSVVLATMVLGIHWLSDVIGGVVLAVMSVVVARWAVSRIRGGGDSVDQAEQRPIEQVRL